MRELANVLLVFLLNLIASTSGPAEPPFKGGNAPVEKPPVVEAAQRAGIPICEAALVLIPAPVPQERDLLLLANARARASRSAAGAPVAQRGEEKKPRVHRLLVRRVSLL
jgi:hypothetical protein